MKILGRKLLVLFTATWVFYSGCASPPTPPPSPSPTGQWSLGPNLFTNVYCDVTPPGFDQFLIGDLNGDHQPEIITIKGQEVKIWELKLTPRVSLTLRIPSQMPALKGSISGALADLDGDGLLDVVLTSLGDTNIFVLRNTSRPIGAASSAGKKISFSVYKTNVSTQYLGITRPPQIADMDGDGKLDILLEPRLDRVEGGPLILLRNASSGVGNIAFAVQTLNSVSVAVDTSTQDGMAFAVGRINSDSKQDIVRVQPNWGKPPHKSIVFTQTKSAPKILLFSPFELTYTNKMPLKVVVGDVNGDGYDDFVTFEPQERPNKPDNNFFSLFINKAGAAWEGAVDVPLGSEGDDFLFGDPVLTNLGGGQNGKPHLIVPGIHRGTLLFDLTKVGERPVEILPPCKDIQNELPPGRKALAVGDLNNDGKPDIVTGLSDRGIEIWFQR